MLNGVNFAVCLSNGSWSKPPSCLPAARSATGNQIPPSGIFPMFRSTSIPSRVASDILIFNK